MEKRYATKNASIEATVCGSHHGERLNGYTGDEPRPTPFVPSHAFRETTVSSTPEFVRWSLHQACPLRDDARNREPEWVERQLSSLRSCGDALTEEREIDGICLEPAADSPETLTETPLGFRTAEVLTAYADTETLDATCGPCPARVVARVARTVDTRTPMPRWAGCFGWIDWSAYATVWHDWVDQAVSATERASDFARHFLVTRPTWYGLWVESPLRATQIELLRNLFERLVENHVEAAPVVAEFLGALDAAERHRLELDVAFGPAGSLDDAYWTVASHCPRCKAARPAGSRRCGACGQPGPAVPARRRHARGTRPYLPLPRFLGAERANELLHRYWRQRAARR